MTETFTTSSEQISNKIDKMVKIIELLERKKILERLNDLCGVELRPEIEELGIKEYEKIIIELEKLNN